VHDTLAPWCLFGRERPPHLGCCGNWVHPTESCAVGGGSYSIGERPVSVLRVPGVDADGPPYAAGGAGLGRVEHLGFCRRSRHKTAHSWVRARLEVTLRMWIGGEWFAPCRRVVGVSIPLPGQQNWLRGCEAARCGPISHTNILPCRARRPTSASCRSAGCCRPSSGGRRTSGRARSVPD